MILVEAIAGSRLYGTNRPDSDEDIRGVFIPWNDRLFGFNPIEQIEEKEPDRVIYSLQKFMKLALANNPNILDLLFTPKEFWKQSSSYWTIIHECRHEFLSQRIRKTYVGYAQSQMNRMINAQKEGREIKLKHAGHVLRLMFQAEEILRTGTFTPVLDKVSLLIVKNVMNGGQPIQSIFDQFPMMVKDIDSMASKLPQEPNSATLERLCVSIYQSVIYERLNSANGT